MRDWAEIGFSSIYYLLAKLERKRWVACEAQEPNSAGPAKRVYRVTQQGLTAWHQEVLNVLSTPQRYCTPLQVGLANLPGLPQKEVRAALVKYCARLDERERYVRTNLARARAKGGLPGHAEFMFDLSLAMTRAELSWVKKLLKTLSMQAKGADHA